MTKRGVQNGAGAKKQSGETGMREPGYGRLQQLLREEILDGTLSAGSRLKVADIARRFGTSTNPAREALQALEGEGLVVITPNRGATVRLINEDLVRNIFDIRELLEPYIVRHFVEYAMPADVENLRDIQTRCQAAVDNSDYSGFHVANAQLHDYIIDRHHNLEAIAIMKKHNGWVRALSRKNPLTLAQMRRSSDEHWQLIESVEIGDPERGAEIIWQHMQASRSMILEKMRRERVQAESSLA